MKVYARWIKDRDNEFRRNTLLQFGDSWELIGSAVLVNPGSAKPIKENEELTSSTLNHIKSFYSNCLEINVKEEFREFYSDPTMNYLQHIFSGFYIGQKKNLNGVIQLFNLFNYRKPDKGVAVKTFDILKSQNFKHLLSVQEDIKLFRNQPVYFGWGAEGDNRLFIEIRKKYFERGKINNNSEYINFGCFGHPRRLGQFKDVNMLKANYLFHNVNLPNDFLSIPNIDADLVFVKFIKNSCLGLKILEEKKGVIRFELPVSSEYLVFSIVKRGYIGIRNKEKSKWDINEKGGWLLLKHFNEFRSIDEIDCINAIDTNIKDFLEKHKN